jgi:hypothetical protein
VMDREAVIKWSEEREVWIGIVFRRLSSGCVEILSIGCEESSDEAIQWATDTIQLMMETDSDDVEVSDMFDRAKTKHWVQSTKENRDILADYPDLTIEDVDAAAAYDLRAAA